METEFQNALGKSMGEVVRDISEFLSLSCIIHPKRRLDISSMLPDLNMAEQFSFALLSEAHAQGWSVEDAEAFYRHALTMTVDGDVIEDMSAAFRDKSSPAFRAYEKKYGNRFSMLDGAYWPTCLAIGIDADEIGAVMQYLKLFTIALMEFAYMDDRNPSETYTWSYYEAFREMLDQLTAPPEPEPLPVKVRAVGGSAGKREGDTYSLSLGVDIENPNPDRMARMVGIDITLKDKDGATIAVIKDQIRCIDPSAIYHYGVTRKLRGAAVGSISVKARAEGHLKLTTPIMKHLRLTSLKLSKEENALHLSGTLNSEYDKALRSVTLHYQFLSSDNKILGGGSEWLLGGIEAGQERTFSSNIPVEIKNTAKAVYSVDFDAIELVK